MGVWPFVCCFFLPYFSKAENSCDFMFASLGTKPFKKESTIHALHRKNLLYGSEFSSLQVNPFFEGAK